MADRVRRLAAAAVLLAVLTVQPAVASAPGAHGVAVGAFVPGATEHPSRLDAYAREVGRRPALVSWYGEWRKEVFPARQLRAIARRDAVPFLTWEPFENATWTRDAPAAGTWYPLRSIAAGRYDDYLRRSARDAAEWGRPILVRFAHEMNGKWYPWGLGVNGNTAHDYVSAWRHVVEVFRSEGADNVRWVWAPNADDGSQPFKELYPGDRWVDWVGLSAFNFGDPWRWRSLSDIVGDSYEQLARMTARPMILAETGSAEDGGDKAQWIGSAFERELPKLRRVRAVVWFNERSDSRDWRVDSSAASLRAFRSAVAQPRYDLTGSDLLAEAPAADRGPVPDVERPAGGFGAHRWWPIAVLEDAAPWLIGGAIVLIGALAFVLRARRRRARTAAAA